jgi:hypothetical protein
MAFLRRFCQIASGFHFFGFCNNIFLQSKVVSLPLNPQHRGPGLNIYVPQRPGGPQASGSLFVTRSITQGYGGGILTGLLTVPTKYYYFHTK